jgi:hypothetical protein
MPGGTHRVFFIMKIFRFDPEVGKAIRVFESRGVIQSGVLRLSTPAAISAMHLEAGGVLGYHPTTTDQLFLVVGGAGWVRGETPERTLIAAGQAALWVKGEFHESGTDSGMTAIVIEGEDLNPAAFMSSE